MADGKRKTVEVYFLVPCFAVFCFGGLFTFVPRERGRKQSLVSGALCLSSFHAIQSFRRGWYHHSIYTQHNYPASTKIHFSMEQEISEQVSRQSGHMIPKGADLRGLGGLGVEAQIDLVVLSSDLRRQTGRETC